MFIFRRVLNERRISNFNYSIMKHRMRIRDRKTAKAHRDIEAAIWDSSNISANYIVKEITGR